MAKETMLKARSNKNDEFYTQLSDIEAEISQHKDYVKHFENKVVFCNCDDPEISNFFLFFKLHFKQLKLKKLIATHYNKDGSPSYKLEWNGETLNDDMVNLIKTPLTGDGDFRSPECIELLKEADIIVTNPPFSLFREYVSLLIACQKHFIIIGNQNAIAYKEIFPLLQNNEVWLGGGFSGNVGFFESPYEDTAVSSQHKKGLIRVSGVMWFTNLDLKKRHEQLILIKKFNKEEYPKYENFDAIEVSRTADIPCDYPGVMGVPITFMDKYCPDQFKIIGLGITDLGKSIGVGDYDRKYKTPASRDGTLYYVKDGKGVVPYARVLIQNKHPEEANK